MEFYMYIGIFGFFFGIALFAMIMKFAEVICENHRFRKENEVLEKDNLQLARNNKALRELLDK